MIIDNAGTYTLRYTATDDCGKTTTVDRELVVQNQVHTYGIVWDGSESTRWTRIGESALFEEPSPAVNNGTGSSPFDNLMPWSGMQVVEDEEAGTLVSIPKFYYKWTHGIGEQGNGLQLEISDNPQEGFFTSPAHMDRGDGVGERDIVYVGRYPCTTPSMKSLTNTSCRQWLTRSGFRTNIHALGTDIWQFDLAMLWTINMLYLVEFADWDSQRKIGFGVSAEPTTGLTDSMQYHTGTNVATKDAEGIVQYRHIEGLWSNLRQFIDGLYFSSNSSYVIKNPADFDDTQNGTLVATVVVNEGTTPKEYCEPPQGFEYALMPIKLGGNNARPYDQYVADGFHMTGAVAVRAITGYDTGLFEMSGLAVGSNGQGLGSRLMKLPSA